MSKLKRPLTKNFHISIRGDEPILNYCNNLSINNYFPVGLIIISKMDLISSKRDCESILESKENEESEVKIKYINQQAAEIFDLNENDNVKKIHYQLKQFKQFNKNQITDETLDEILFDPNREKEYYGFFKNQISLIYVKYRINNEDLYICADYYTDERKLIQSQLFQTLKFQYIATLFHELYNPMNALLFMIDIQKNNKNQEKEDITNSNFGNNNSFDIDSSELSDNDCDKLQESENNFLKKKRKIDKKYQKKLNILNEKEKDIGLLVNMIYIFLQNLILYLRINLGVRFKVNDLKHNEENHKENENGNMNNNIYKEKEKSDKYNDNIFSENIYSDNYLSQINKNKKINLEFSFCKHLDKFSYLFNYKNIHYCNDFSYLSDKYIITDESVFYDFLGQIYSFLYYIVPKSKGYDISYSVINDNKLKILFLKTNCPKKRGYRSKKSRRSFSHVIGEDKFEATSTVKTQEMTQEILYKLSEILGIKLKIMEYEHQNEDIYLTIILPFSKDNDKDILNAEINKVSIQELVKHDIQPINIDKIQITEINDNIHKDNQNQLSSLSSSRNANHSNKNINYLNPNFFKFAPERKASFLVDEIEEKNSSEEDLSSQQKSNSKDLENDKNHSIPDDNKKKN